jgi:UDP-glucose 4-epimerase
LKTILITGGAGYLGLNIALELIKTKNNVVIIDDLKNSYKSHVNKLLKTFPNNTWFYKGDVCDYEFTKNIFNSHKIDYVLHLASLKYVGESIKKPKAYEKNNIDSLKTILSLSKEFKVSRLAFSSSAVVYGNTNNIPATEDFCFSPLSPYAKTKCDCETLIQKWNKATNIPITIFRFSNPVGANSEYMFADHSKKGFENLVPYIVKCAFLNKPMTFRGNNHPTPDGTAIRDYLHVSDLAEIASHILLNSTAVNEVLNISSGKGTSVLEILKTTEQLLNKKLDYSFSERNPSEASVSILDISKLKNNYSVSTHRTLDEIIQSQIDFFIVQNKSQN